MDLPLDTPVRRDLWTLDPAVAFLNHGSFGACPRPVLDYQTQLRVRLEREPVRFLARQLEPLLDAARTALGAFAGGDPEGLAFVPNATTGVNTVLASLRLAAADELLITDHAYPACRNALEVWAARSGARVVVARVPFPLASEDAFVAPILDAVTPRTRLALLDHVTAPTALVAPLARLVRALEARGVDTLVDAAHAPGMVPLALEATGAAYTTFNAHKWLCAPKGAAALWVRADRRERIAPLVVSLGHGGPRPGRSRFRQEFDWTGTTDPTPWLAIPEAIRVLDEAVPGGWAALIGRQHALALAARESVARRLGLALPCPAEMVGGMASLPLPAPAPGAAAAGRSWEALEDLLYERHGIESKIFPWENAPGGMLVRLSAATYNTLGEFDRLAEALAQTYGVPREVGR
ncbi:MAG: aminotransferase class V-fold PLP-dependent enzyme [Acidobacteria bacterium]|nr:aminotransferase class V-fold PLP-dependent enzyme [Acidobacteriota bacterium]